MSITGQVVDTETANEFMAEALQVVTRSELGDIVGEIARKAERFQEILRQDHVAEISDEELHILLRHIFATRRIARKIIDFKGLGFFQEELPLLLYGKGDAPKRFQRFVDALRGFSSEGVRVQEGDDELLSEETCCDLASELLHFNDPENHWLWTRWMWHPRPATGALALVVEDSYDLMGETISETYTKVGIAVAFVKATGEQAGFAKLGDSAFDIDVFLACVYAVYMYTTLRLRMTQEFNKVVPQLPELVRRLLGVWKSKL